MTEIGNEIFIGIIKGMLMAFGYLFIFRIIIGTIKGNTWQ